MLPILITGKLNNLDLKQRKGLTGHHQGGFTLMELIVVCLLVSLTLTITIPSLRDTLYSDQFDSATRKIIGTIQELRNTALRENKPYLLIIEVGNNRLRYEIEGSTHFFSDEEEKWYELPEDVEIEDVQTSSQGKMNTGKVELWVSRRGYMDQTALHLVSDERKRTLFFTPFFATPYIYEEYIDLDDK